MKIRCHQNLKYKDVVVQNEINDTLGYHKSCYQKFNALSEHQRKKWKDLIDFETDVCLNTIPETENAISVIEQTEINPRSLRSSGTTIKTTTTGVFRQTCIFCRLRIKTINGVRQKLISVMTKQIESQIKQFAIWRDDQNLLSQIGDIDFVAKEIKYHNACRLQYERIAISIKGKKSPR